MTDHIVGASVWEQEMYDYISLHAETERDMLREYQALAEDPDVSPAFRYVAALILDDEVRHHQAFNDLASALRQMAELRPEDKPIPSLRGLRADRERVVDVTERLLAAERHDAKLLKDLSKRLADFHDTTLWGLVVELMRHDTDKHIKILKFIRDRARDSVV